MNVPPFSFDKALMDEDWMTEDGARVLARRIKQAWRAAGHKIEAKAEKVVDERLTRKNQTIWTVTTNLFNGLPPAK